MNSSPHDPLATSCEIESLRKKLSDALLQVRQLQLGEQGGHHLGPEECPTYYDGCHCSVTNLLHNIKRAEDAERLVHELQEILIEVVNWGGNNWHKNNCPEDDTCDCPKAARANAALKGYTEKRKGEVDG